MGLFNKWQQPAVNPAAAQNWQSAQRMNVLGPLGGLGKMSGSNPINDLIMGGPQNGGLLAGMDDLQGLPGGDIAGSRGRFRSIGDFLKNNRDDILKYGTAAGEVYKEYKRSRAQKEMERLAKEEWNRRRPLRDAGMKELLDDSSPDMSSVFADPENPNGRYRRVNVGSMR